MMKMNEIAHVQHLLVRASETLEESTQLHLSRDVVGEMVAIEKALDRAMVLMARKAAAASANLTGTHG